MKEVSQLSLDGTSPLQAAAVDQKFRWKGRSLPDRANSPPLLDMLDPLCIIALYSRTSRTEHHHNQTIEPVMQSPKHDLQPTRVRRRRSLAQ